MYTGKDRPCFAQFTAAPTLTAKVPSPRRNVLPICHQALPRRKRMGKSGRLCRHHNCVRSRAGQGSLSARTCHS